MTSKKTVLIAGMTAQILMLCICAVPAQNDSQNFVKLPSGLQYRILKESDNPFGKRFPSPGDKVVIHYSIAVSNGEINDLENTYRAGENGYVRMIVGTMIKGLDEAIRLMKPGSEWELTIPPHLAYGDMGLGRIPPGATLYMKVFLKEIM